MSEFVYYGDTKLHQILRIDSKKFAGRVFRNYQTKTRFLKDSSGYPFADTNDIDTRDPRSMFVENTENGIAFGIRSRGAIFSEYGNKPKRGKYIYPNAKGGYLSVKLKKYGYQRFDRVEAYTPKTKPFRQSILNTLNGL